MTPRRIRWLFLLLVVGQFFFLAAQTPDRGGAGSLLEGTLLRGLGPVARLVEGAERGVAGLGEAWRSHGELERENRRLKQELLELRRRELRLDGLEQEIEQLARAEQLVRRPAAALRVAEVVFADYGSWLRSLVIYVGDGTVRRNEPVLGDAGLVGRVVAVAGGYAKVQLITDRAASVGVQLSASRRQGVLRGSRPGELTIDFVPRQAEVENGDAVLTSGIDGVYPRGIPVGTVVAVEPGSEVFHRILVRPAVDFSRLAFVYLLEGDTPPAELSAGEGAHALR